jgi:shikimate kinase
MKDGNYYLIGPMGAGKTAVGRQLAKELGLGFVDVDAEIESRTGVDIPHIFDKEGEAGFRQREEDMIGEICKLTDVVVATGGGAILSPVTRQRLVSTGTVIYLETAIDEQLKRTTRSRNRPLLDTEDPRQVLEELMSIRKPLYESTADIRVDTTGRRVRQVTNTLRRRIRERAALQN